MERYNARNAGIAGNGPRSALHNKPVILNGDEVSSNNLSRKAAVQLSPARARQTKDAGVFVPEGPDDGSDSTELAEFQPRKTFYRSSRKKIG
jgi:hypothetical protein